jgi:hypothetical protein
MEFIPKFLDWYCARKKIENRKEIPFFYIITMKVSKWYLDKCLAKYQRKRTRVLNICMRIANISSTFGFISENEKSLFYALAGDLAWNVSLYGVAERMYENCIEFGPLLPDLTDFAFKRIMAIKQEFAIQEAEELKKSEIANQS